MYPIKNAGVKKYLVMNIVILAEFTWDYVVKLLIGPYKHIFNC